MNLDPVRAQFPVLGRVAYLNAGTNGPLARATVEAMAALQLRELEEGRSGMSYFTEVRERRERVRAELAALVGAPTDAVSLQTSTTGGCNVVLAGLRLRPDDEVVTTDEEHFGLLGALHVSGARVRVAHTCGLARDEALANLQAEIGPRTRLVALSHVSWLTGNRLPVEELADGPVRVLVDGAQSGGAIRVDATRFDYYTVSGQKWPCGPDGTGALVVRDADSLAVAAPSYFSQDGYRPDGTFVPKPGAGRFDCGVMTAALLEGLSVALGVAPADRWETALATARRCHALLSERFEVITRPGESTLVSFIPAAASPADTVARLAEQGVVVRDLPGTPWVRVSCGWWTSDDDLDRLIAALVG